MRTKLNRELHDAMETFVPPADVTWQVLIPDPAHGDLICHHDLASWNLIRNDERRVSSTRTGK
jgi:Ser/Thr protein kinase RdoA (MazF antagonist)